MAALRALRAGGQGLPSLGRGMGLMERCPVDGVGVSFFGGPSPFPSPQKHNNNKVVENAIVPNIWGVFVCWDPPQKKITNKFNNKTTKAQKRKQNSGLPVGFASKPDKGLRGGSPQNRYIHVNFLVYSLRDPVKGTVPQRGWYLCLTSPLGRFLSWRFRMVNYHLPRCRYRWNKGIQHV